MAEIGPVAANVKASSDSSVLLVQYGETVTQGEAVYLKASDGKHWLADNSTTTLAAVVGMSLTPGAADGYGYIAISGDMDLGATLSVGEVYCLGSTSGAIHPVTDLATTEILTIIGYGKTAALLKLDLNLTEIAHA